MFLRFTVAQRHPQSHTWKGLFSAAAELRGSMDSADIARLDEALDWFNSKLPVPRCFKDPRAICWFTAAAGEPLTKMWRLVTVFESNGTFVQVQKTRDPGMRVYRDAYQVVAIPQGRHRVRMVR